MSFGLLKHFKDTKKNETLFKASLHFEHLILGEDLESILKLMELRKTASPESIRLVSKRPLTKESLVETYENVPGFIRSEKNVEDLYRSFFHLKVIPQKKSPVFFKEGKFYDFGGRAKSMEMQSGEEYFLNKGYKLTLSSLFSEDDWENLDQILKDHQKVGILESIEKATPTDLVHKTEWRVSFKDYTVLTCENLYLGFSPKKLLPLLTHKETLTGELINFTSSVHNQSALAVTWILDKEIHSDEQTLFIPQSMTHEWGHFIVEFDPYSYEQKTQAMHALILIHDEEPQTEDLGSKIKLLKRVLDRVFPDFEKHIKKEFIRFDDEMFVKEMKQNLIDQMSFDYPTLKFLKNTFIYH